MKNISFSKNKFDSQAILLIKRFFEVIDLFNLNQDENFVFNSELLKSFEKLNFPDWRQHYPIHDFIKDSPFASFINLEKDFFLDFKDEEIFIKKSQIINEIKKLENKEQIIGDEVFLNEKQADLLLSCYAFMNFSICAAIFGESPFELFKKAETGDQNSILKLIQLDKSLIESDWSMKEIKKAHLSGDKEYFKKLSKAIASDSFKPKKKNLKLTLALIYGWELGLNNLTNEEIFDVVKELGIYGSNAPDSLNREINRLGLVKRDLKKSK